MDDYFGFRDPDEPKLLTPPAGYEAVHQAGMSWAKHGFAALAQNPQALAAMAQDAQAFAELTELVATHQPLLSRGECRDPSVEHSTHP